MLNTLFLLVCPSSPETDAKIRNQYQVLVSEPGDLLGFQEYVLYFPEKKDEDTINAWCTDNVPMSWYVEPLY